MKVPMNPLINDFYHEIQKDNQKTTVTLPVASLAVIPVIHNILLVVTEVLTKLYTPPDIIVLYTLTSTKTFTQYRLGRAGGPGFSFHKIWEKKIILKKNE